MKPRPITTTKARPNRVLIALAAAWMILSLAIGGAVSAGGEPERTTTSISGEPER